MALKGLKLVGSLIGRLIIPGASIARNLQSPQGGKGNINPLLIRPDLVGDIVKLLAWGVFLYFMLKGDSETAEKILDTSKDFIE